MSQNLPKATHTGVLQIGDIKISCAVLEDGTRILTHTGFSKALGRVRRAITASVGDYRAPEQRKIVPFADAENLKPFADKVLSGGDYDHRWNMPFEFILPKGGRAVGYNARLFSKVARIWFEAGEAGILQANQVHIAQKCKEIILALAETGIVALVDEATGYQEVRPKDELQRLLNRLLAREPLPAERVIAQGFFDEVVRVWQVHPQCPGLAQVFNNLVYRRLAPGLLPELKERNSDRYANGKLKKRHTQWLADPEGRHAIIRHVETVSLVLRSSQDRADAYQLLDRLLPVQRDDLLLPDGGQC